ncbi:fat storage-inducing transmembrane protein 1 [Dunckerocampus dactyliophorus]|uniref:fat storage-inducing transmembrane protein 1 n=1 Tax=Dunckerocampus dactyliophorus TaxID=161453 RepID=UPI002406DECD|nr:fat storage-inducing transmembrane protein 1 [Dunckerocampus dactyliophorus]
MVSGLILLANFLLGLLNASLVFVTNLTGRVVGSEVFRRHFHLLLSTLVLVGPVLSLWVSKYSIFANSNHYLYRKFLNSTWGWTCTLTSSFIILLSLSAHHPASLCLRHLSRLGLSGLLWWGCQRLLTMLEDAAGTCYEPVLHGQESATSSAQPLLLLHEDQTKASCLNAKMLWRGYEVSQDVLILCLCCLLLVEELSVFGSHLKQKFPHGGPLRFIFLLGVLLLAVWVFLLLCVLAHFPKFPAQQLGGALGYLGWRCLYQGWFRLKPNWHCPGLPGDELSHSTAN